MCFIGKKCLRCGEPSGKELYCWFCINGYSVSYLPSKREIAWQKRTMKRIDKLIEESEMNIVAK